MDSGDGVTTRGHYSVLRFMPDSARGEFRNLAVLFVDVDGQFRAFKSARAGAIGRNIEEHGLLAAVLETFEERISRQDIGLTDMQELARSLTHSLVLSDPLPAVSNGDARELVESLYQSLVAPRHAASAGYTKGHVIDRLSRWYKSRGGELHIGSYVKDYLFDAVAGSPRRPDCAMHVTSFAARTLNPKTIEQEAGHFLFAAARVKTPCVAVVQPPAKSASPETRRLQETLTRWFQDAGVAMLTPDALRKSVLASRPGSPRSTTQLELPRWSQN